MGSSCNSSFTLRYPKIVEMSLIAEIYKIMWVINSLFRMFLRLEVSSSVPSFCHFPVMNFSPLTYVQSLV